MFCTPELRQSTIVKHSRINEPTIPRHPGALIMDVVVQLPLSVVGLHSERLLRNLTEDNRMVP